MKVYIKKWLNKKGYFTVALCINDVIVSFDKNVIMEIADMTPSQFKSLEVGNYPIN